MQFVVEGTKSEATPFEILTKDGRTSLCAIYSTVGGLNDPEDDPKAKALAMVFAEFLNRLPEMENIPELAEWASEVERTVSVFIEPQGNAPATS